MAKPRRSTKQEFYDVFSDWEISDQETVLEFLQEIHRMAKRRGVKAGSPVQGTLAGVPPQATSETLGVQVD